MQPTRYAIRYTIYDIRYTSDPNRRNTPNSATTPNKPPIKPKLSTNYDLIMQNKPNFPDGPMNVIKALTKNYENKTLSGSGKNKANSKPIKANFQKAQMNVNLTLTKDYRKNDAFAVRKNKPNSNPIFLRTKTNATLFTAKGYENEPLRRRGENKPNQTQSQYLTYSQRAKKKNYLYMALFPLTSPAARDYNEIFSRLSIWRERQLKGFGK